MTNDPNKPLKSNLLDQEEHRQDLGFGTKITDNESRLVNPDGSFNVRRVSDGWADRLNLYHLLITMPWQKFLFLVFCLFFFTNLFFASIYLLIGIKHLGGVVGNSTADYFWEAFFFSAQTITTVGYGRVAPIGSLASAVAALEALLGLLAFALATGLLYGRFSRPVARIRFSKNAVVAPYLDINGLMFRIINRRNSEIIDLQADLTLSYLQTLPNGTRTRKYFGLPLERRQVNFFPLSWTVVHPLTPDSPLFGFTASSMAGADVEFLILIRGQDETFSQQVQIRHSYRFNELVWGAKFVPMFDGDTKGVIALDLKKLDSYQKMPLNQNPPAN